MFLRKKRIRGKDYFYLVRSVRVGNKVRQKIVTYFGRDVEWVKSWSRLHGKRSVGTTKSSAK